MIDWNDLKSPVRAEPGVVVQLHDDRPDTIRLKPNTHFTPYTLHLSVNRADGTCVRHDEIEIDRDARAWYSYIVTAQVQPDGGLSYGVLKPGNEPEWRIDHVVPGDGSNEPLHLGFWVRDHTDDALYSEGFAVPDSGFWHTALLCIRPRDDRGFDIASLKVISDSPANS